MDLKSGYPFWAVKNGLMHAYPRLESDVRCDVVLVGGGISGALVASELAGQGFDVVLVEQRDIGWGSTSASTALLQYEIDTHLVDLSRRVGEADALLAYHACVQSVLDLGELCRSLRDVDHAPQESLYFASRKRDAAGLREEFELRSRHGFPVSWIGPAELQARFGLDAPGAILSHVAARVDPYRMTYRLLARLARAGMRIHDRTCIAEVIPRERGVELRTDQGVSLRCQHVVMATGYASQQWLSERVARNRSSYAYITDPLPAGDLGFLAGTMLWETARPYLYLRSTGDGRLLVGGEDDDIDLPGRRDARVGKKARSLCSRVGELYPGLDAKPAYSWAGTFAETSDGLPFFGAHRQTGPRVLYAMAYGGNGITYSMIGAALLGASIQRRKHALAELFGFERLRR